MNLDKCTCDEMTEDDKHPCPFAEDVYNETYLAYEDRTMCTCCPYCEYQCAMDI